MQPALAPPPAQVQYKRPQMAHFSLSLVPMVFVL